jgi:hypothetical protein
MKRKLLHYKLFILPVFLLVGILIYILIVDINAPREEIGPEPTSLHKAVPLDGATNIKKLKWSPSGKYILIEAVTTGWDSFYQKDGLIVVIESYSTTVVCRLKGMRNAFWGNNDTLWVLASNKWFVYKNPFKSYVNVLTGCNEPLKFPAYSYDAGKWAFNPQSNKFAIVQHVKGTSSFDVHVYQNGQEFFTIRLTPKYPDGGFRVASLTSSPSGNFLSVVFKCGIGPNEFWLIDINKQSASHIHNGKIRWWQIIECDTQNLEPSWSTSEDAVVYGDRNFGIGELAIPEGRTRTILGKNTGVYDILLSPSGKWIAFKRWPSEKGITNRYDRCMGVVSRNRRRVLHLPKKYINWPYMYADWNPTRDVLAVLRRNPGQSTHELLYWNLEETSNKTLQQTAVDE